MVEKSGDSNPLVPTHWSLYILPYGLPLTTEQTPIVVVSRASIQAETPATSFISASSLWSIPPNLTEAVYVAQFILTDTTTNMTAVNTTVFNIASELPVISWVTGKSNSTKSSGKIVDIGNGAGYVALFNITGFLTVPCQVTARLSCSATEILVNEHAISKIFHRMSHPYIQMA